MPLILCPNDNGSMQTVQRSGVEFDMCPTCRGVWLDRGELEKLLEAARGNDGSVQDAITASRPRADPERRSPSGYEGRYDHDDDYRRKKKRPSIFDIFD